MKTSEEKKSYKFIVINPKNNQLIKTTKMDSLYIKIEAFLSNNIFNLGNVKKR